MSIVVHPVNKIFKLKFISGDESLVISYAQLLFDARNKITSLTSFYKQGKLTTDHAKQCFLNMKYAIKSIEGLEDEKGNHYKLKFDEDGACLTDECVDELLATEISDKLLFAAQNLSGRVPLEILNPMTGLPLEGVEILPDSEGKIEKNS